VNYFEDKLFPALAQGCSFYMSRVATVTSLLLSSLLLLASPAFSWGERGHDLVTRAAVRILIAQDQKSKSESSEMTFSAPFQKREHMLGHLANVPDILWRDLGKEIEEQNAPTHYIDLEYLSAEPSIDKIPTTVAAAEKQMAALCAAVPDPKENHAYVCPLEGNGSPSINAAGSAPWRVQQFFNLMKKTFAAIKTEQQTSKATKVSATLGNQALLYAGLMSHFVGDLAQPLHTTRDYNGWERQAAGLHSFFETQIIDAFDFTLDGDVLRAALQNHPVQKLAAAFPKKRRQVMMRDPFAISVALALDSFGHVSELLNLDKKVALTKPSSIDAKGVKFYAERRPSVNVAKSFRSLAVNRLAIGADTTAYLWYLAWEEGGKPDMSDFFSFEYAFKPDFIPPDYLIN
jgi:hypothetical protein